MSIAVLVLFAAALVLVSPVLALVALARISRLERELDEVQRDVDRRWGRRDPAAEPAPAARPAPAIVAAPLAAPKPVPPPVVAAPTVAAPTAPTPAFEPPPAARPPAASPSMASTQPPDFATNLGPRLLVATGALAFVVFLGLFVKYAWDNDWVGPTGRLLLGALASVALVAGGLRLLGREYRPLGLGLAGAGVAGLYVSAFGAHGFYDLVSREVSGALMAAITVNAVLLALRLDARLLAALAWIGAYLTPVLLSTGEDRAVALFLYLLVLDLGALALDHRKPWPETIPLAMTGTFLLYAGWHGRFYGPDRFAVAAAGLVLFTALFAVAAAWKERRGALALALVAGAFGVAVLASATDRPAELSVLLLAHAALATSTRRRWRWSEHVALLGAAAGVAAWMGAFFAPGREADAIVMMAPAAGFFFAAALVRGLRRAETLPAADVALHLLDATFAWSVLYAALYDRHPRTLGLVSVALAAVYLALGAACVRLRRFDRRQVHVLLGLAAVFVTIAIPVQLGLHGITLLWALEALLLLALGLRHESLPARAGGYLVLGLAVLRLFARHALVASTFTPVWNARFGTWLAVIAALGAAAWMRRRASAPGAPGEAAAVPALTALSLVLLFGLLTVETGAAFDLRARLAAYASDADAARRATLAGRLAISVLWTVFATGLLAGGLAVRSRPLFYAAYALFGVTAVKVVLVDTAALHAPYRMLSFLALALLMLAGAYLNLRFRERMLPGAGAP